MRQTIREVEPARPSTALSTMHEGELSTTAKHRHTDSPKLVHLIRGDLDWIVMKCLEKDRSRRYETANGLAMDVERHLNNEPIVALPRSQFYRFGKLVRRNKLVFAAAGTVMLALLVALGISTWSLMKETAARKRAVAAEQNAKTEAAKSEQVTRFLEEMLQGAGPAKAKGRDATMLREILDKTVAHAAKNLTDQPLVQAELLSIISNIYLDLGEFAQAEAVARQGLGLRQSCFGDTHRLTAASLMDVARVLTRQWRRGGENLIEGESLTRRALEIWKRLGMVETKEVATATALLAGALQRQGKLTEAEKASREALALRRKLYREDDAQIASSLDNLALVLRDQGKLTEAEAALNQALSIHRTHPDSDATIGLLTLGYLAGVLEREGKLEEAEAAFREVLPLRKKIFGNAHPTVLGTLNDFAELLLNKGQESEAAKLLEESANAGSSLAQYRLGLMYASGKGVPQNDIEALKWFRKAAEQNHRAAQNSLGSAYFHGRGVPEDEVEAVKWYRKSAEQGSTVGQIHLAQMFASGRGVEKNETEAAKWFQKATANGDADALNELAWHLATSRDGKSRDGTNAVNYAEKAVSATGRTNTACLDTLAAAHAETGQFEKAISIEKEAISVLRSNENRSIYEANLKLFEAHTPVRE
jgi:tetratricopeptide (TPR) repeat protein